jgi:hypothetical protein
MVLCDHQASGIMQNLPFSFAIPFFLVARAKMFGEFVMCSPDAQSDMKAKPEAQGDVTNQARSSMTVKCLYV